MIAAVTDAPRRLAFVVQRAGDDIVGGAESACLQLACRMRDAGDDVEILTTTARDYSTWANAYEPGVAVVSGTPVRRFAVDAPRDPNFDRLSRPLARRPRGASAAAQTAWMRAQGPYSSALLDYVRAQSAAYDGFVFFGYLYATTYFALPFVASRAVLVPFAHDEWPIRLPMFDALFAAPRAVVASSPEERAFLHARFPAIAFAYEPVGIGIEAPAARDPHAFRRAFGLDERFVLYLGRVDAAKNVPELVDAFVRYRRGRGTVERLVLAGTAHGRFREHPAVTHAGRLSEELKWSALEAATALVMPSRLESLSLAVLEAWACAKPVIVDARSPVLAGHLARTNGGFAYASQRAFDRALERAASPEGAVCGRAGEAYVRERYAWPPIVERYRAIFEAAFAAAGS